MNDLSSKSLPPRHNLRRDLFDRVCCFFANCQVGIVEAPNQLGSCARRVAFEKGGPAQGGDADVDVFRRDAVSEGQESSIGGESQFPEERDSRVFEAFFVKARPGTSRRAATTIGKKRLDCPTAFAAVRTMLRAGDVSRSDKGTPLCFLLVFVPQPTSMNIVLTRDT